MIRLQELELMAIYLLLKSVIRLVMVNVINKNESKYEDDKKERVIGF